MEFRPGILGVNPPMDGGLGSIAPRSRVWISRLSVASLGTSRLSQERANTLNSIAAKLSQLPCLGV